MNLTPAEIALMRDMLQERTIRRINEKRHLHELSKGPAEIAEGARDKLQAIQDEGDLCRSLLGKLK